MVEGSGVQVDAVTRRLGRECGFDVYLGWVA